MLKVTNTLSQPTCNAQNIGNETYIIQQNHSIIVSAQENSSNSAILSV